MNRNSPPPPQSQSVLAWAAWKILHSAAARFSSIETHHKYLHLLRFKNLLLAIFRTDLLILLLLRLRWLFCFLYFLLLRKCRSHLSRTYFVAALPQFARRGIFLIHANTKHSRAIIRQASKKRVSHNYPKSATTHYPHEHRRLGGICIRAIKHKYTRLGCCYKKQIFFGANNSHFCTAIELDRARIRSRSQQRRSRTTEDEPPCLQACFRSLTTTSLLLRGKEAGPEGADGESAKNNQNNNNNSTARGNGNNNSNDDVATAGQ